MGEKLSIVLLEMSVQVLSHNGFIFVVSLYEEGVMLWF